IGSRCTPGLTHDWWGYKSPDQMAVVERWSSYFDRDWFWIVVGCGVSLVLDCRWFWSVVGCGLSSSSLFVYITIYLTGHHIFCFSLMDMELTENERLVKELNNKVAEKDTRIKGLKTQLRTQSKKILEGEAQYLCER